MMVYDIVGTIERKKCISIIVDYTSFLFFYTTLGIADQG